MAVFVVHSHNGLLHSYEKGCTTDRHSVYKINIIGLISTLKNISKMSNIQVCSVQIQLSGSQEQVSQWKKAQSQFREEGGDCLGAEGWPFWGPWKVSYYGAGGFTIHLHKILLIRMTIVTQVIIVLASCISFTLARIILEEWTWTLRDYSLPE